MWAVVILSLSAWSLLGMPVAKADNPHGCQVWSTTEVTCVDANLKYVPPDLPASILRLDLQDNWIKEFHKESFGSLKRLQYLDLSRTGIRYVENGTFASMKHLRTLNLSRNNLGDSQWSNITSSLPSLQTLILSNNRLQHLNRWSFMGMYNLTFLNLSSNVGWSSNIGFEGCALCGLQRLQVLDMSHNKLRTEDLPDRLFHPQSEIEFLDLSGNWLRDDLLEKEELWSRLTRLRTLNVRRNLLSIPKFAQSFRNLTSLNRIDMSRNNIEQFCFQHVVPILDLPIHDLLLNHNTISTFEKGILLRLRHLKTLSLKSSQPLRSQTILTELQHTQIQKLEWGTTVRGAFAIDNTTFGRLPDLEELDIHGPGFYQLEEPSSGPNVSTVRAQFLQHSRNLTKLNLGWNNIDIIDGSAFKGLGRLERLELQFNNIETLPAHVFDPLRSLTYLDLTLNKLQTISARPFNSLLNLQWLYLTSNGIIHIDNTTFIRLRSLTHLYLNYNSLVTVRNVVGPNLRYLTFRRNRITELKANEFSSLANLVYLSLESNDVSNIEPGAFQGLGKLEELDLSGNSITTVTSKMFQGLENVTELYLSSNDMTKIEPYGFYGLRRLPRLQIGSSLSAIPPYAFVGLDSLTTLALSHNRIIKVERHAFDGLPNIEIFALFRNKISLFEEETFGRVVRRATRVSLDDNPFFCDCRLLWFVEWARENPSKLDLSTNLESYKCNAPPEYAETYLSNFHINCTSPVDTDTEFRPDPLLACVLSSSAVLFYMFAVILVSHYHWKIKYLMFLLRRRNENDEEPMRGRRFVYDAFVAHNSEDIRWVVHELCHNLEDVEDQPRYKLCIHQRNFLPGAPIVNNIVKAIETSRKTICVLTRSFLRSGWCEFELQLAQTPDNLFGKGGSCRLILVFLEKIPRPLLKKYKHLEAVMDRDTYLEWPGDARGRPLFWRRLRAALGKPVNNEQAGDGGMRDDDGHELVPLNMM
ncbi:toll-like receptor 4 [Branchiostoma floridae]|uniref:Toll-like receptor 4 n=2 Tax=Branchiostoma floridae TaxID=7739 RepID=A0A9J7MY41_BRAFL|nr:toll-like receptor 4 [Branchiostoma floridae]